ncbi:MAG: hypothetical protein U0361_15545 [Nitrospiraceae bacterium]
MPAASPGSRKAKYRFSNPASSELVTKGLSEERLHFTTDVAKAVDKALVIFIAVGTPPKADGSADLSLCRRSRRGIAKNMTGYKAIVTKSTSRWHRRKAARSDQGEPIKPIPLRYRL